MVIKKISFNFICCDFTALKKHIFFITNYKEYPVLFFSMVVFND